MDIQKAEDMRASPIWATAVEELNRKINYESKKLLTCSPEELRDIQTKISCYESLKNLPADIIDRES